MTLPDAASEIMQASAVGDRRAVHLVNAYTLALASRDARYADVLAEGDLNLPDGAPVAWLGKRMGLPFRGPVPGPLLMERICSEGRAQGLRHYLYGSAPETLYLLQEALSRRFPGICIVGAQSPPFRPLSQDEEAAALSEISRSGANIVWVGLGTPRQDHFVARCRGEVQAPIVAVGAAFDFLAGTKSVAPSWMRGRGLEWIYRFASEPRRLWRRYVFGNARFLRLAAVALWKNRR
jgi:N-acetylglucosaminyldiphosphoundecaprenol N-acetyl-beta-D-mannosaminyltransferase